MLLGNSNRTGNNLLVEGELIRPSDDLRLGLGAIFEQRSIVSGGSVDGRYDLSTPGVLSSPSRIYFIIYFYMLYYLAAALAYEIEIQVI